RAMILYYYANTSKGLVVGTGDKSEILLGYFTKYGDGACDIQPIADLYKSAVRDIARHLGLPRRIFSKPSSPELWPGQIAEDELGLEYSKLDSILWRLERWMPPREISDELRIPRRTVEKVRIRWLKSEHPPRGVALKCASSRDENAGDRLPTLARPVVEKCLDCKCHAPRRVSPSEQAYGWPAGPQKLQPPP